MHKLLRNFLEDFNDISDFYSFLITKIKNRENIETINECLVDHYDLVIQCKNVLMSSKKKLSRNLKYADNIYSVIYNIVNKNQYNISYKLLIDEIDSYQNKSNNYFTYRELSLVIPILYFIYINKLNSICEQSYQRLEIKEAVQKIIDKRKKNSSIIEKFQFSRDIPRQNIFIFELNQELNLLGEDSNKDFRKFNQYLEKNNISLRQVINDECQEIINMNLLISNIFSNLKDIMKYQVEDIFKKVSKCEKILIEDSIYSNMSRITKNFYREQIYKISKKNRCSEFETVDRILLNKDDFHIGYALFKNNNSKTNSYIFIICVFMVTCLISFFLSYYFIPIKIIGFLILFVPVLYIIMRITSYFFSKLPVFIPRLDYSKGLSVDVTTMIVVPTIIDDLEKVKEVFNTLETYYIANKTDHLYFSLLGSAGMHDNDLAIAEYGKKYAETLNKKYKKNIFFFVYCNQNLNDNKEKNAAFLHFNRYLLKKLNPKEKKKYYYLSTLDSLDEKIKYVIKLDPNMKSGLNTCLNLIGCMAHPLNRPVLDATKTKVISGYGMMQAKMSLDIEVMNHSLYSRIFSSNICGNVLSNTHQRCFGESFFKENGIYDLEVFDQVLCKGSSCKLKGLHELLESNYLRCCFVSDLEFINTSSFDFFLDSTRNCQSSIENLQMIGSLFFRTKNDCKERSSMSLLTKYKILDDVVRVLFYPVFLLILVFFLIISKNSFFAFLLLFLVVSLIISFNLKNHIKKGTISDRSLVFKLKLLILRSYLFFSTIPFYTELYLSTFFTVHKKAFDFNMGEAVDVRLTSYVRKFVFNIVLGIFLFIFGLLVANYSMVVVAVIFINAPFLINYVNNTISKKCERQDDRSLLEMKNIAMKTWNYFEEFLKEENYFLIPDNFQDNSDIKVAKKTSATDIAFSLMSVICAKELDFISTDKSMFYLENILKSVDSLEKWNGHLYKWYSIEDKSVLYPKFVSTVDSGNFIASLMVCQSYLEQNAAEKLAKLCEKMIREVDFKKLYTNQNLFSIGYESLELHLANDNYNKLASISRLTSFVAIAKGDVSNKHWSFLEKSLITYDHRKGLESELGTASDYYMPLLFMKNYSNTVLDEAYQFAHACQKSYVGKVDKKLPWGISRSAYNQLDISNNYKCYDFSVFYLTKCDNDDNRIVISPYSSLMVTELYPKEIYDNILKFKKLSMLSMYGFYDAYDYSSKNAVRVCFADHQGMSLMGLTNYLKNGVMKDYFHQNTSVDAYLFLLKEQSLEKTNTKIDRYKKYNYKSEIVENDVRKFDYISNMPEVGVLSNKKYTLLMNDRGDSFSRYRLLQINRYRKVTKQDYGIFFYIKDLDTNNVWSNTYAPMNKKPDKYEVMFLEDKIKYFRSDGPISTKTEITVLQNHAAEIRKITFYNDSNDLKRLQITSYTEPILCENIDDISHRTFQNMFLSSIYDDKTNSLIMRRKSSTSNINLYLIQRFFMDDIKNSYTYETDRIKFVGRNRTYQNPLALSNDLSCNLGVSIDPIMSLRGEVEVAPNSSKTIYFVSGFGRSMDQLFDIVNSCCTSDKIKKAFQVSSLMSFINTRMMNVVSSQVKTYNIILNHLYQTTKIAVGEDRKEILRQNSLSQSGLWKFGISGDRPIILVNINNIDEVNFVFEILKAFEYFKSKSIFVDLIIVNSENREHAKVIKEKINDYLYRMSSVNGFSNTLGSVKVISKSIISVQDKILLKMVPRLVFNISSHTSLKEEVRKLQRKNKINVLESIKIDKNLKLPTTTNLKYFNSYGGFCDNGSVYVIEDNNTPMPWSNVIANDSFGTIVTNNGCGYTYGYNSSEFKISAWTNEKVLNDKSEGIKINNSLFDPSRCSHGFGYSILESEGEALHKEITEFVAVDDPVKLYIVKLKNKTKKDISLNVDFFINPVLGNFEEKTGRHILTETMESNNYLRMRNVYNNDYSDINVFMSSSEKIVKFVDDKIIIKEIGINIIVPAEKEKKVIFSLGCHRDVSKIDDLISKYSSVENTNKEFYLVKKKWKDALSKIEVKTKNESFDYMINGWYLYQVISSRILAKAGLYEVGGVSNYRDQLQDSMNICSVFADLSRKQLLKSAMYQFEEGDVLHWWYEKNRFGLRSRHMDDHLWLVYATLHYLRVTDDTTILNEEIPYVVGDTLTEHEQERRITFSFSSYSEPLLDHLLKSLSFSMSSIGCHNLPLIGEGDFCDSMNKIGIKGSGESVWLGFFLYQIISEFISFMKNYDSNFDVNEYQVFNAKLKKALTSEAFDGKYYLRAYFDNGEKLGSHENDECRIDLISQSLSILSGVCPSEKTTSVINSVEENLVDSDLRIIKLFAPAFDKILNDPGYIKNYPVGIKENGGQVTCAAALYIMALLKTGNVFKAWSYYQMINPINRSLNSDEVGVYQIEPYVIADDIYSNPKYKAHGGWSWYTSSASWFYRVGVEEILGIKKYGDSLVLNPKVPKSFKNFEVKYKYNKALYDIKVIIGKEEKLILDGKVLKSKNKIKLSDKNKKYEVSLYIKEFDD